MLFHLRTLEIVQAWLRARQSIQWEYNFHYQCDGYVTLASYLPGMGLDGWELAHVNDDVIVLKRPKKTGDVHD